jgi:hypothetical protein
MAWRKPSRKRSRRLPPAAWDELLLPGYSVTVLDADLRGDGFKRAPDVKRSVTPGGCTSFRFRWIGPREVITLRIQGRRS